MPDPTSSTTYTRSQFDALLAAGVDRISRGVFLLVVGAGGAFEELWYKAQYGSASALRRVQVGDRPAGTYRIPLATHDSADGPANVSLGWAAYDPAAYDLSGLTVALRLRFCASMSLAGAEAVVELVNLSTSTVVSTVPVTSTDRLPPTAYQGAEFTASASATVYELRARVTDDGGDPASFIEIGAASLDIVSWEVP